MSDVPSAAGPDIPAFSARWKASGGSERANTDDVVRLLEMLAAIGKARTIKGGKYVAS